ncbi:gliding motility-associated C-terminal domain-containing protein [Pedobacter riviphilus]|uniref:Gliding motility-associated C-terminal domain-containing protein n=1 Tax=Pedobacter riviphilus TaxID=2766984 RepID=A0ABX6TK46_9SPHI|nr:gliding motility-associated C-terminal domain-containing protein [Pedobacter riviphilus]
MAGETAGDYDIQQGTLALSSNYTVNYTPAKLHIYAKPVAALSGNISIPLNTTAPAITFTATAGTAPFTFTYNINGGVNQTLTSTTGTATITPPSNTVGTFVYTVTSITDAYSTQPQNISTTVKINPIPVASIAGTTALCLNGAAPTVTFTGGNGTGPYVFTYNINGGTSQTVSTAGTNTTATVTAPSNVAGTFNYNLLNVSDVNAGQAQSGTATITVRSLATASISGSTAVPNLATAPNITFTGANGTAPYTFTYNINGGANRTVTSTGNTATVSAPTSTVGTFVYNLVSVADVNCAQPQTGSATVIIRPLPVATIAGTTSVCNFGSSPNITFTGSVGTAPYTFTYTVNGGSNRTVSTNATTATVSVPTNAAGTFTYTLVSVADAYANQLQTGTATVTVNALPVVSVSSNKGLSISKGDAIVLTATGGTQYSWTGSDIISGQNTPALTIRPKQSGTYRVTVSNASGCVSDQSIAITVIDDYKLEASTVVTPNGDGYNDKFIVKNIDYYPNNTLKIFDKAGRILYTKHTYANDWDGTINGSPLSEGTYYYIIDLGSGIGTFKGFINIIRD